MGSTVCFGPHHHLRRIQTLSLDLSLIFIIDDNFAVQIHTQTHAVSSLGQTKNTKQAPVLSASLTTIKTARLSQSVHTYSRADEQTPADYMCAAFGS